MPAYIDDDNPKTSNTGNMRVSIPEAKYAPEPEPTPDYKLETPNFADDKDVAMKVADLVWRFNEDFTSRSVWETFRKNCDIADELMRAAKNRTQLNSEESSNVENTRSNVKSATFYTSMRAITAGEASVILGNQEELPVEYEPLAGATGDLEDQGEKMADDKNAYLSWVISRTEMREKIKKALFRVNKYGNQPIEMFWDYRKTNKKIKIPFSQYNKDTDTLLSNGGKAKGLKKKDLVFVEREMTIADWPDFRIHDVKDFRYDVAIDDIQQQSCVLIREQMQLCDVWKLQRTGLLTNVGEITTNLMYLGEGEEDFLENRQSNAGESNDSDEPNSLFDVWRGWVRVPIDQESGKWDEKSVLPSWYEFWFIGDLEAGGGVKCLRLSPHYDDDIPVEVVHAIDDDKGGIHIMHSQLVSSLLAQEMTVMDQYFDNNTARTQKSWIMEPGAVQINSLKFGTNGQKVWVKRPGAPDPHEIEVQDTTQSSAQMLTEIDSRIKSSLGTNKPFLGEPMGSRTSASEAITGFEQALKPALEDAKYKANQLLPFIAKWVDRMAELFSDPEQVIMVTYNDQQVEIKPAMFYGPMTYRVASVKKFQDNAIQEKLDNQFVQTYFGAFGQLMGKRAMIPAKQIALNRGYKNVEDWFPEGLDDADAIHVAQSENTAILLQGVLDMPMPDENHEAHLGVHEAELATVSLLGDESLMANGIAKQSLENFKVHIQQHKNLMSQKSAGPQGPGQAVQAEGTPGLPGEMSGDQLAAEAGALENLPGGIPEQGAPPAIDEAGLI